MHKYCSRPLAPERQFDPSVAMGRRAIILAIGQQWANGTNLTYYMYGNEKPSWRGADTQKKIVREAFSTWKNLGIGISFTEVQSADDAIIRIGFMRGDGSWSYVGRYNGQIPQDERTMNFGWDLTTDYGMDTALHEIGHAIGLEHEHQNPQAGIKWNEEAVYSSLAAPPNEWDRTTTYNNIIKKL